MCWHPSKIAEKRSNVKPEDEEENSEPVTKDPDKPSSRFEGTNSSRETFEKQTPGQSKVSSIKKIVKKRNNG